MDSAGIRMVRVSYLDRAEMIIAKSRIESSVRTGTPVLVHAHGRVEMEDQIGTEYRVQSIPQRLNTPVLC